MRPPETLKYLFDIAESCRLLEEFTSGKSLADYSSDALLRSAVERQFEIIGEALRLAIREEPELAGLISNSSRIIAFRNRLTHGYAGVLSDVVWGILETPGCPILGRLVSVAGHSPRSKETQGQGKRSCQPERCSTDQRLARCLHIRRAEAESHEPA